jgi:hypothetical protein
MATFTWKAGTSADWNVNKDWSSTSGAGTPAPGSKIAQTDTATLGQAATSAYAVTVSASDQTYDLATLGVSGRSTADTTTLDIKGLVLTNRLAYLGSANDALVTVDNGGLLDVRNTLFASSAETITIAGTGTGGHLEFGSAGGSGLGVDTNKLTYSFNDNSGKANAGEIEFLSGFKTGKTNATTQKITGLSKGNSIIFDGANFNGDTFSYSGTTLTVTGTSATKLVMKNVSGPGLTSGSFKASGNEILIVCYAAGTHILTPTGERLVESLVEGDEVLSLAGGTLTAQRVKWIGSRRIVLSSHPRPETVAPVRIQRDAFADGIPHAELMLSPDHAVLCDSKLICARQLINGTTIRQDTQCVAIEYYHIELDEHAILVAEGLSAESYLDTGNRGFFSNSDAAVVLHPNLTDESDYPSREAASCAPFVWDEATVRPIWQRLADRATALGQPVPQRATTGDAAVRLVAQGRTLKPAYADEALAIFSLPRDAREVRVVSRAVLPIDTRPWLEDRRRLGVRVARIVLLISDDLREIPVDHPDLASGWWAVEREGSTLHRWTDGNALLPLPAICDDALLVLHFGGAVTYLAEPEADPERGAATTAVLAPHNSC